MVSHRSPAQRALRDRRNPVTFEPGLAVGRLRAHRKLVELRSADLSMDAAEAAALLEQVGLRLSDHDVDTLVRRTEGWSAGLYLAALSVRAEPDARSAVESFAGDDRLIADYQPDAAAVPARAGLEDGYMALMHDQRLPAAHPRQPLS